MLWYYHLHISIRYFWCGYFSLWTWCTQAIIWYQLWMVYSWTSSQSWYWLLGKFRIILKKDLVKLSKVIHKWITTESSPVNWDTVIEAIEGDVNNKWKANEIRKHINKGKDGIFNISLVHAASYHRCYV